MNNKSQLSISSGSNTKKLSAGQRKFNALVKKIEKQRQTLQAWETATPLYIERWHEEFLPHLDALNQRSLELVQVLDELSETVKLSKTDRHTLTREICTQTLTLLDSDGYTHDHKTTLKALYNKHSGRDFDTDESEGDELLKQGLQEIFGVDLGDEIDTLSAEQVAQKMHEHLWSEQTAQQHGSGKKTASQSRQEAAAAQASQSVREIYRKLASALHPDRETDPLERERKTELMQRVNHAYGERNLLELLQLQLEIEHINADTLDALPADRLKHYNQVLSEQLEKLHEEVFQMELMFKQQFQLDPFDEVTPKNLAGKYRYQFNSLLNDINAVNGLREDLKFPKILKAWLKEQRAYYKEMDAMDLEADLFDEAFDDLPDSFFR